MAIPPYNAPRFGAPEPVRAEGVAGQQASPAAAPAAPAARETAAPAETARREHQSQEDELRELATRASLAVRLHPLADGVVVIQFVDPQSSAVVHEFPNHKLAEALADMRARARARLNQLA